MGIIEFRDNIHRAKNRSFNATKKNLKKLKHPKKFHRQPKFLHQKKLWINFKLQIQNTENFYKETELSQTVLQALTTGLAVFLTCKII